MATRRWGISQGERAHQVTEAVGAAVAADNVELTIDLAAGLKKDEATDLVRALLHQIERSDWPPA